MTSKESPKSSRSQKRELASESDESNKNDSSYLQVLKNRKEIAGWNALIGFILVIVIFFGSQAISEILLSLYRIPKHWSTDQIINWLQNSISAQFLYVLLAESIVILMVVLFVRRYKNGLKQIGLRRPKWTDPLWGLSAVLPYFIVYFVVVGLITYFYPSFKYDQKQQLGFNHVAANWELLLTFISLVILPPIAEEILFRGLLYSSLKKNMPTVVAVIGTSLLFAAGHLPEGGNSGPLYIAGIDTFILSFVLILLREKTGGLWASMTLHGLKNFVAFVFLFHVQLQMML